ncbi:MAG: 4Fe-4S dicluster domain-containing protein [Pseudomonadota bacterium]
MIARQIGFDFEVDRCVQCHACEVACRSLHAAEPGIKWRRVTNLWGGSYPDLVSKTLSLSCLHCGEPACEAACPTNAIRKRAEDGIVVVDQSRCIGCRTCFLACPFGVPQFGADGKMQKCDLCVDRLAQGKEPACVATCPADAIHYGPMDELVRRKSERVSNRILTPLMAAGTE